MKTWIIFLLSLLMCCNLTAQTGAPDTDSSEIRLSINRKDGGPKIIHPTSITTASIVDGSWYLRSLKITDDSTYSTDENSMWFELNTFTDNAKGFGSCNAFDALVKTDQNALFKVSKLISSSVYCETKHLETLFFESLKEATRYELTEGRLILFRKSVRLMEFSSMPGNKEIKQATSTGTPVISNESTSTTVKTSTKTITTTTIDSNGIPVTNTIIISTVSSDENSNKERKSEEKKPENEPVKQESAVMQSTPNPEQEAVEAVEAAVAAAVEAAEETATKKNKKSGKKSKAAKQKK
jgi:heat shock protein HslJ